MDILQRLKEQAEICSFEDDHECMIEAAQEIERLRKQVEAMQWRDIESAPKDVHILICSGGVTGEATFVRGLWYWGNCDGDKVLTKPTHWMHLPKGIR